MDQQLFLFSKPNPLGACVDNSMCLNQAMN